MRLQEAERQKEVEGRRGPAHDLWEAQKKLRCWRVLDEWGRHSIMAMGDDQGGHGDDTHSRRLLLIPPAETRHAHHPIAVREPTVQQQLDAVLRLRPPHSVGIPTQGEVASAKNTIYNGCVPVNASWSSVSLHSQPASALG